MDNEPISGESELDCMKICVYKIEYARFSRSYCMNLGSLVREREKAMERKNLLEGKNILVVDDEPDVLDTLVDMLDECNIETASTYEEARELLKTKKYDAVILDIMGVRGFDLLELATRKKMPAMMLTAQNLVGSIKLGAKSYIPKDKIGDIAIYLEEIFQAKEKGIEKSGTWFARLSSFFDDRFGYGWKTKNKRFWSEFDRTYEVHKDELERLL